MLKVAKFDIRIYIFQKPGKICECKTGKQEPQFF